MIKIAQNAIRNTIISPELSIFMAYYKPQYTINDIKLTDFHHACPLPFSMSDVAGINTLDKANGLAKI
jgi:hypothetical protein